MVNQVREIVIIGAVLGLVVAGYFGYKTVQSTQLFSGPGVGVAEQFTGTTTPDTAITQRTWAKQVKLSGYNSYDCLGTSATGLLQLGTCSGGGGGSGNVATSTTETAGQLAYWTSTGATPATLGKIATGTITVPTGLTGTASRYVIGGNFTLGLDTGYVIPLQSTLDAKALGATTFTIAGTANQITSSAGAQDLSANRTVTLSIPNLFIMPSNASSTLFSTTYGSSTNQVIGNNFTFGGVTGNSWDDFCTTITGGSGLCDGTDATSAGGADPFTWALNFAAINAATSSILWAQSGLNASSTSHFDFASTTQLSVGSDYITDFSTGLTIDSAGAVTVTDVTCTGCLGATEIAGLGTADISGLDISDDTNLAASWPIVLTGDTLSWNATTTPWAANGFVYTNAAGLLVTAASSTLNLPNTALANSTISGVALGSNLNALTNDATLAGSSYNGSASISDWGLNLANPNTWTGLQIFANATTTLHSSTYSSSTNQVIGNNLTFGGVTADTWPEFCATITGGAGLCDGDDATGAGGSAAASTTADVIIYKTGSTYYAYNASTTVVTNNTDFDALLQANVNIFDDGAVAIGSLGGKIYIMPGIYYADTVVTINGNNNGGDLDSGSVTIEGSGVEATKIVMNGNANFLDFDNAAIPKIRNLSVYIKGSSSAFVSDSASNDLRAMWNFEFKNLHVTATTTSTGWAFNLGNAFRGTFDNIEMFNLHNCARFLAEGTFNPGDFTWNRSFCEHDAVANAITFQFATTTTGFMNQMTFIQAEGIAASTGATFIDSTGLSYSQWYGVNAEQYDIFVDGKYGTANNTFQFNYITHRDSIASLRGCRFWSGASGNTCNFGFLNTSANFTVVDDMNGFTDSPNVIMGYVGADSGTASASTSASTVTLYRDISGYGTMDTNLKPDGNFGTFQFLGTLVARGATAAVNFASAVFMTIPTGTAPVISHAGDIAYDSTDKQFLVGTTTANSPGVLPLIATLYSRTVASTSPDFVSGGRIGLPSKRDGFTITEIECWVEAGTSVAINLDTNAGGSNTDAVTCATTRTTDTAMSANYSIAAGTLMAMEFGTVTGAVDYVHVTVYGFWTRE